MSRERRFNVASLDGARAQARIELPETEWHHARVLRLQPGDEMELFDGARRIWRARLDADGRGAVLIEPASRSVPDRPRLILATAWPKGKRAATLVEKCTELGVDEIVPLRCARSVVVKDSAGAGMERLRRIAAEAAKQSGRATVPEVRDERTIAGLLGGLPEDAIAVVLDPGAEASLAEVLGDARPAGCRAFLIGPEGGFTPEELAEAKGLGARVARLGSHVLRVETAAMAVCAVVAAIR